MKKTILILIIALFSIKWASAELQIYEYPTFWLITPYLSQNDIEPGYNPQPEYHISVYKDFKWIDDTATAQAFCEALGYTLVNYVIDSQKEGHDGALYYPAGNTWREHDNDNHHFPQIVCEDGIIPAETGTGASVEIINNISNEGGLDTPVFDTETIVEIYKIEGLIMVLIVLFTFFSRLTGNRQKRKMFF